MNRVLILLALLHSAPAFAECEIPVSYGAPNFVKQLRNSDYALVFAGEVLKSPKVDEEGEAIVTMERLIVLKHHLEKFEGSAPGKFLFVRLKKNKGVRLEAGKPFIIFANREKDRYVLKECNHSYLARGVAQDRIIPDIRAIHPAYAGTDAVISPLAP